MHETSASQPQVKETTGTSTRRSQKETYSEADKSLLDFASTPFSPNDRLDCTMSGLHKLIRHHFGSMDIKHIVHSDKDTHFKSIHPKISTQFRKRILKKVLSDTAKHISPQMLKCLFFPVHIYCSSTEPSTHKFSLLLDSPQVQEYTGPKKNPSHFATSDHEVYVLSPVSALHISSYAL